MKITIVTEKSAVSRLLAPYARKHWPQDEITIVHVCPFVGVGGGLEASLPRGLKLQDYPVIRAPQYRVAPWSQWASGLLLVTVLADGRIERIPMAESLLTGADLIVFAGYPDRTGASSFALFISQVLGEHRVDSCQAIVLSALDGAAVEKAFEQMMPFGQSPLKALAAAGLVKRHFDWNWHVNALTVLGSVLRQVGVPSDAPFVSKYALQVLYFLRDKPALAEGVIISEMQNWKGTGRYGGLVQMGSPSSVAKIVDTLRLAGLLYSPDPLRTRLLRVSDRGLALLEALHPDCEDPDLPYRLDAWCEQGDAAYPSVDRYIRTFFGKQMRFARRAAIQA